MFVYKCFSSQNFDDCFHPISNFIHLTMSFSSLSTLVLLAFLCVASALPTANITTQLQSQLSPGSKIFLPSDVNYTEEVTARWTIYGGPTYRAVIQPALESDVQTIVCHKTLEHCSQPTSHDAFNRSKLHRPTI